MDTASSWDWLIGLFPLFVVLLLVGGVVAWMSRRSRKLYPGELKGFGGWLALLAVATVLQPFGAILHFFNFLAQPAPGFRIAFPVMFYGHVIMNAVRAIVACLLVWAMVQRSRKFPVFFLCFGIYLLSAVPIGILFDSSVYSIKTGFSLGKLVATAITKGTIFAYCFRAVVLGASMLYVTRSNRVANTFMMP